MAFRSVRRSGGCHAYGDKIVLLLAGYDKAKEPSTKRQQRELDLARIRLKQHDERQKESRKRDGRKKPK